MPSLLLVVAVLASVAGSTLAGDPRAEMLRATAEPEGTLTVGGRAVFRLSLSNAAPQAVTLDAAKGLSAWLTVGGVRGKAFFTERLRLETESPTGRLELPPGGTLRFKPADAGAAAAFVFDRSLRFTNGYFEAAAGGAPESVGSLCDVLATGRVRAKWMLAVALSGDSPPLHVWTGACEPEVGPPRLASLSAVARRRYVADLIERFDRDAWSARAACGEAARLGPAILPDLVAATSGRDHPPHARLWMATVVAEMPSAASVEALTGWLDDPDSSLRGVVAYYGPQQRSEPLDAALIERAKTGTDAGFTAYALLGMMVFRGSAPEELVEAGIGSEAPRVRAMAARALSGMASELNKARLKALLEDPNERVRTSARKVLDALTQRQP